MSDSREQHAREIIDRIYREDSRRIFATLVRLVGDFDLAEESLHEAFAAAVASWPAEGIPEKPLAWLVSAGRFKAIDAIRRMSRFESDPERIALATVPAKADEAIDEERFRDDRLRLIFTFLACDASGVMPPISRLTPEQAIYHFISGYTSKIAGTEIGLGVEPEITFSACFGGPFMVHHPYVYADLLRRKMLQHGARCWLVNTGWTGGPFGIGRRISIGHTRKLLDAALTGALDGAGYRKDPIFGFDVPESCEGLPTEILDPANTWGSRDEYYRKYDALAARFIENFKLMESGCPPGIAEARPKRLG